MYILGGEVYKVLIELYEEPEHMAVKLTIGANLMKYYWNADILIQISDNHPPKPTEKHSDSGWTRRRTPGRTARAPT